LSREVAHGCGSYERLGSFYRIGFFIPAGDGQTPQAIKDAFVRRGQIFVTLATEKLSSREKAACIRWLEARATTVYPTDLVAWLDLVESMVTLGARDRIAPEDILVISEIEIERDPDAPRVSFDTHAAARILHLLESGRP
jgi:hypothetical protein